MPSLRLLRAFSQVAETTSFRAAAAALHITQPALSLQIKDLEDKLGVQLFERQPSGARLTRAGEALLPKAHHILSAADDMAQFAKALGEPLTGRLRLGVIPTIAPYLLPRLLQQTGKRYPDLQLQISEDKTENLVADVRGGSIDVALLALPLHEPDLHEHKLFDDEFVLAVPQGHALARSKNLTTADIMAGPLLLLDEGHCLRDQALSFCKAPRAHTQTDFRAASLRTLTELVSHGIGVTLLPSIAVKQEVQAQHKIKLRPLPTTGPMRGASRAIGLIWRENHPGVRDFKELAAFFGGTLKPANAKQ